MKVFLLHRNEVVRAPSPGKSSVFSSMGVLLTFKIQQSWVWELFFCLFILLCFALWVLLFFVVGFLFYMSEKENNGNRAYIFHWFFPWSVLLPTIKAILLVQLPRRYWCNGLLWWQLVSWKLVNDRVGRVHQSHMLND